MNILYTKIYQLNVVVCLLFTFRLLLRVHFVRFNKNVLEIYENKKERKFDVSLIKFTCRYAIMLVLLLLLRPHCSSTVFLYLRLVFICIYHGAECISCLVTFPVNVIMKSSTFGAGLFISTHWFKCSFCFLRLNRTFRNFKKMLGKPTPSTVEINTM